MTPNNKRVMACVVDTECTYISTNPNMVYHFGAVFGDITQTNSLYTKEMYGGGLWWSAIVEDSINERSCFVGFGNVPKSYISNGIKFD